ncbi:MAG: hypothetical protein WB755_27580 [Terriglobales bacterium]
MAAASRENQGKGTASAVPRETGCWRLQPLKYALGVTTETLTSLVNRAAWEETMLWEEQPTAAAKAE